MARNLIRVIDAIQRAEQACNGLDALISLLCSARNDDLPKGEHLAELLNGIHLELVRHLAEAQSGMMDAK